MARQGVARLGGAWPGVARRGGAWHGKALPGAARLGGARRGQAWLGKARQGKTRRLCLGGMYGNGNGDNREYQSAAYAQVR